MGGAFEARVMDHVRHAVGGHLDVELRVSDAALPRRLDRRRGSFRESVPHRRGVRRSRESPAGPAVASKSLRSEAAIIGGPLRAKWIVVFDFAAGHGRRLQPAGIAAGATRPNTTPSPRTRTICAAFLQAPTRTEARDRILGLREAEAWAVARPPARARSLAALSRRMAGGRACRRSESRTGGFRAYRPVAPAQGHAAQLGAYLERSRGADGARAAFARACGVTGRPGAGR